jgi:hypothetical protein
MKVKIWLIVLYRLICKLKKLTKLDVFWIFLGTFQLIVLWTYQVSIDSNLIPTIVNGASSTTALLVAFIGILMTVNITYLHFDVKEIRQRLYWALLGCAIALGFVSSAYLSFMGIVNFELAFRNCLTGLIISIIASTTFAYYMINKVDGQSPKIN